MFSNILKYLYSNNILCPYQYVVLKGKCCETAELQIISHIINIPESLTVALSIFVDLTRFHTLNHNNLLEKNNLLLYTWYRIGVAQIISSPSISESYNSPQ